MNVLVTAGNTRVHIDRVRCITNIFTGRTGAGIALEAFRRGHCVTLLTSQPGAVHALAGPLVLTDARYWQCAPYDTFAELRNAMASRIQQGGCDAVIHSAAVSDYEAAGVFAPAAGSGFLPGENIWRGNPPTLADRAAGKIKSDESELWLRLVRAPKLVDLVRREWGFTGLLVKFKLEVGVGEDELCAIAERSRRQSGADWMVANTLEDAARWAYVGSEAGYERVDRERLSSYLLEVLETRFAE